MYTVKTAAGQPTTNLAPVTKSELFVPYVYGKSSYLARDRVYLAYQQALDAGLVPEDE